MKRGGFANPAKALKVFFPGESAGLPVRIANAGGTAEYLFNGNGSIAC